MKFQTLIFIFLFVFIAQIKKVSAQLKNISKTYDIKVIVIKNYRINNIIEIITPNKEQITQL